MLPISKCLVALELQFAVQL